MTEDLKQLLALAAYINVSRIGVIVMNADSEILYSNRSANEIFNCDMVGTCMADYVAEGQPNPHGEPMPATGEFNYALAGPVKGARATGEVFDCLVWDRTRFEYGGQMYYGGVCREIKADEIDRIS